MDPVVSAIGEGVIALQVENPVAQILRNVDRGAASDVLTRLHSDYYDEFSGLTVKCESIIIDDAVEGEDLRLSEGEIASLRNFMKAYAEVKDFLQKMYE